MKCHFNGIISFMNCQSSEDPTSTIKELNLFVSLHQPIQIVEIWLMSDFGLLQWALIV